MPDDDFAVEDALNHTMAEIRSGAAPWWFDEKDLIAVKEHYRPGFTKVFKDWNVIKDKIHRLARYQGGVAALLEEALQGPKAVPRRVRPECLWLASAIVQVACPKEDVNAPKPLGGACPDPIPTDRLDGRVIAQLIANFRTWYPRL